MKILFNLLLISLIACNAPINKTTTTQVTRKILFQSVPGQIPTPADGKPGIYKTTVKVVIDDSGVVTRIIPEEGPEPLLSHTIDHVKNWRFSPKFPAPPDSPVSITITYYNETQKCIEIFTNLNPGA
ncbi:MAG: hypothetical protein HY823_05655 [Acidobacteria bacterium]|nr:hypothetical protein [Acidobacteriota bacterium]